MGGACGTVCREEKCIGTLILKNAKEGEHFG